MFFVIIYGRYRQVKVDPDQNRSLRDLQFKICTNPRCLGTNLIAETSYEYCHCYYIPCREIKERRLPILTCADCGQRILRAVHVFNGRNMKKRLNFIDHLPPNAMSMKRGGEDGTTDIVDNNLELVLVQLRQGCAWTVSREDARLIYESIMEQKSNVKTTRNKEEMFPIMLGGQVLKVSKKHSEKIETIILNQQGTQETVPVQVKEGGYIWQISHEDARLIYESVMAAQQSKKKKETTNTAEKMVTIVLGACILQVSERHAQKIEEIITAKKNKETVPESKQHSDEQETKSEKETVIPFLSSSPPPPNTNESSPKSIEQEEDDSLLADQGVMT